jgi:hypothetical protein
LKPDDLLLTDGLSGYFGVPYWTWCAAAFGVSLLPLLLRPLSSRFALVANGLLTALTMAWFLIPIAGHIQQQPIKQAGLFARNQPGALVLYGINTPSFQTYAGRKVERREPRAGDLVLLRHSRLAELPAHDVIFRDRSYVLARMQ